MRTLALSLCLACTSAFAAETAAVPLGEADRALLKQVETDLHGGGILAIAPEVPKMEASIAGAELTGSSGDTLFVLADGMGEALAASAMAAGGKGHAKVVTLDNPYPALALYLGIYYDEIGKSEDGLRVLDLGLSRSVISGVNLGETRPLLLIERGEALNTLHRWDDALADFDDGLKDGELEATLRAHLYRGRGFALTELNRLDDAEASNNEALKLVPGDPKALHELKYISQLRAGGPHTQGYLGTVQPSRPPLAPAAQTQAPSPSNP